MMDSVKVLAGMAAVVGLVGCGGSDDPDPLQTYREQVVQWTACDESILGNRSDKLVAVWEQVSSRLQCATIKAPLDWSQADRGDVSLGMMRIAAGTRDQRRGALFFNPGGPGIDGLKNTFGLAVALYDSNPESPQGALLKRVVDAYDLVGFSPRGVGASTRLECGSNELERRLLTSAAEWDTPQNIADANYNGRMQAQACLKNPMAPYINSDATARDMDLMRTLLGDDQLNYVGYSYGTWLGSWYANLFPQHVGRMVLDSSVDFTRTLQKAVFYGQPPARQQLFDDVLAPYAARHNALFGLGATRAETQSVMPGLQPKVQQLLAVELSNLGYARSDADAYLKQLVGARGFDTILRSAVNPKDIQAVQAAINAYPFLPNASPFENSEVAAMATRFYRGYYDQWLVPAPLSSFANNASASTSMAIHCNDTPVVTDLTGWERAVRDFAVSAPMFFQTTLQFHACPFWGGPSVRKPDFKAMEPLNVLFVQSQYDAATYTPFADQYFDQLPRAQRVYVRDDFQHAVFPYGDTCVDPTVLNYLLGNPLGERQLVCPGLPLPQDLAASANAGQKSAVAAGSMFQNPAAAQGLIDQFKRSVIPPALSH